MRFHDCRQKWLRGRQQAPGGLRRAGRRLRLAPISPTLVSGLGAWQAEETPGLVERVAQTVKTTGERADIESVAMFAGGWCGPFARRAQIGKASGRERVWA